MKIQAYRVPKAAINANRMPNFAEMGEGSTQIIPIKIRNIASFGYHIAEDAKGDIFLINDDVVMLKKLDSRNLGVSEVRYLLDGQGKDIIKDSKNIEDVEEVVIEEEIEQDVSETEAENNEGDSNDTKSEE